MSEQKLPMAGGADPGAPDGAPDDTPGPNAGDAAGAPVTVTASSARLIGTLALAGALAGLAIVIVFQWAKPRIDAYQAKILAEAVTEVLGGPERYETVYMEDGRLTLTPSDTTGLDRVYIGFDDVGQRVGVAMVSAEAGFQDIVRVIFGYDPDSEDLLGMKVLESKETPGLGDKIEKDSIFVAEFSEVGTPLLGVKKNRATGAHDEVVMITGATISSTAVINIINHRLEVMKDPVRTFWSSSASVVEGGDPAGATTMEPADGLTQGGDR